MIETEPTLPEQAHLDELVQDARRNKASSQQLALDAVRLLSTTTERLESCKDSGFFKRCWYRLSGKTAELASANQADLIEMQKYAQHYLNALQGQNLLQARAIAVIRNNLRDLAAAEAETRAIILRIVEKFDERVAHVEAITAIVDWRTSVNIAERGYKALPPNLQMLKIVFDYLAILQRQALAYDKVEVRSDLEAAFAALSVDYNRQFTLAEFVAALADELAAESYDAFRALIALEVSGTLVDARFILQNVSGVGYNSVYHVAEAWPHVAEYVEGVAQRKASLLKKLQSVTWSLETSYTLIELAREILAGSLLAQDIYRELHPEVLPSADVPEAPAGGGFSIQQLLGNFVNVNDHALLKTEPTVPERETYLESFALICASMRGMSDPQRSFLRAIGRVFGCGDRTDDTEALVSNASKIRVDKLVALLGTPERQFSWIIDAVFLATCDGQPHPDALATIGQMAHVLNIKDDIGKSFIEHAVALAQETDQQRVIQAIGFLNRHSQEWKTIIDYRRFSFKGAFARLRDELWDATFKPSMQLTNELQSEQAAIINCMSIGNENFFQRAALFAMRTTRISNFRSLKKKVDAYGESLDGMMTPAKRAMNAFGFPIPSANVSVLFVKPDEETALSNEKWCDNMMSAFGQLVDYVGDRDRIASKCSEALAAIEAGKWA